jgi:small subunit ribosomal protein S17e
MNGLQGRHGEKMARVRTQVKKIVGELFEKYPEEFTVDFENNKKLVKEYTNISSTKLRNMVAGYAARLANTVYVSEDSELNE